MSVERLPPTVEANAYFAVSEAVTNIVKHSGAMNGSGLIGLKNQIETLGGSLEGASPIGNGTHAAATRSSPPVAPGAVRGDGYALPRNGT